MLTPEVFDPSGPGVGKQMMLDWLRINHPKTPVRGDLKKFEVAKIVRAMQPQFFPTPDIPPVPPPVSENGSPSTISVATSVENVETHRHPSGIESQDVHTVNSNSMAVTAGDVRPAKRFVSFTEPRLKKRNATDTRAFQAIDPPGSPKPAKVVFKKSKETERKTPSVSKKRKPILDKRDGDERRELKALEELPPLTSMVTSSSKYSDSISCLNLNSATKNWTDSDRDVKPSLPGSIPLKMKETPDLIDLANIDYFSIENLVIGNDIPAITNTGVTRSGADVFVLERQREEKFLALEESMSQLTKKLDENQLAQDKHQKDQTLAFHMIEQSITLVEEKTEVIETLNKKVNSLEGRVTQLIERVNTLCNELQTQEDVIERLMRLEDGDVSDEQEDIEDKDGLENADYNSDDC
ncbi:uncharacterized protein MELLADRAFT_91596 [Melampsora larici-populina 98AG31]|uniref:Uncharacterized protein n=1 Tax=Melampsora larici-populina (strain 98AG31 / pathotype 3-4-7) TaxID=747676 RepID=F4RZL8_MELLP|nr:uncharacterized protein MELLADRAFT_91596 [Melampsora larici-populina 98AG31]EGG02026.1 hypothetical protein MELLADRAFT_91596 [Melampsora larici-populina 98AG31]